MVSYCCYNDYVFLIKDYNYEEYFRVFVKVKINFKEDLYMFINYVIVFYLNLVLLIMVFFI